MEELLTQIKQGHKKALETLVENIRGNIFNLSVRFLTIREDAEDATQEILVKIITNLGRFEGKSKFTTWTWRIAVNHLLNIKKSRLEQHLNFSLFGDDIVQGLRQSDPYYEPDKEILVQEVKTGCTLGMLLCLDRNLRIAYILGEVFSLSSREAGEILDITPENFRKRFSMARQTLQHFMNSWCGLVNRNNNCRCHKRINYALAMGRINKTKLNYVSGDKLLPSIQEMEQLYTVSDLFKSLPSFASEKTSRIIDVINNLKNITQ